MPQFLFFILEISNEDESDEKQFRNIIDYKKEIKVISNYLAYTIISKVISVISHSYFNYCTTTYHRREWEPQNSSGKSHSYTHTIDGSKEEKGTFRSSVLQEGIDGRSNTIPFNSKAKL